MVLGTNDRNLKTLRSLTGATLIPRGSEVLVSGPAEAAEAARSALETLRDQAEKGWDILPHDVQRAVAGAGGDTGGEQEGAPPDVLCIRVPRKELIRPRTPGQELYFRAMAAHEVVLVTGPAGTGKTYLAVARAVQELQGKRVARIVLVRPAVEAGERLGFLPGSLEDKVSPYLRPLYDALHDVMDSRRLQRCFSEGTIEVVPLAYMRGRSLNDSFVILDEGQNATVEQMKMFLTRLGFGSRAVVCGDITQVDLPAGAASGLQVSTRVLQDVEGVAVVHMTSKDVVRNPIVQRIVEAFEDRLQQQPGLGRGRPHGY